MILYANKCDYISIRIKASVCGSKQSGVVIFFNLSLIG